MINQGTFRTLDGKEHMVQMGTENIFHSFDLGTITIQSNSVACQGQTYRIGDQLVNEIVRVSQYKIVTQIEEFLIDGPWVEVISDRT